MTTQTLTLQRLAKLESATRLPALASAFVLAAIVVTRWSKQARTRTQLADLDPHLLQDIGLTAEQADAECRKAFWQI
ncbi:MAG: DUF1127 domain-containing protein [Pseudomonadota bacterium]